MPESGIPDDVRRFILTSIPSVPHLEAVLLLRQERIDWDVTSVARRLYIADGVATQVLSDLHAAGFLAAVPRPPSAYRYEPAAPGQAEMMDRVADVYARHLIEVTNLLHATAAGKVQLFAEAFKFRKE
ncbi:MAG: hypothetical protein AB7V27_15615 [Candidatus Binatia bacterium]